MQHCGSGKMPTSIIENLFIILKKKLNEGERFSQRPFTKKKKLVHYYTVLFLQNNRHIQKKLNTLFKPF